MEYYQKFKKDNFVYYINDQAVLLEIQHHSTLCNSYIAFNTYTGNRLKNIKKFKRALIKSKDNQYCNINDIYGLANRYHIRPALGRKPKVVGNIAF